ncbi:MAG TPA: glycosyltransferase N-terminal domain-containing protein [Bdellovibrio sp.]|uniref:3-deoxy-D-manno-octulosonic acid transferase n=1 Tax=Bdellovibrio sp. TaxID=28201 RepID=UPI002F17A504
MSVIVFWIYKYLVTPLAYGLLQLLRPFFSGKMREMIEDKNKGFYKIKKQGGESEIAEARPLWIHAASGEIEYARPVIREYRRQHPHVPIMVTYSSPSAKKILEGLHEVDVWAALPWDVDFILKEFITKWNPRALLFSRTDVWPTLAKVTSKQGVPTCLFSATFADNSSRLKGLTRYLTKYSLNHVAEIHCVSEEDRRNLDVLGLKTKIFVSGDTRFDQVFHRLENPKPLKNELMPTPDEFVFIAGSTWPEDESIVIPALAKLKRQAFKAIVAPHETTPAHLEKLEKQMSEAGLPFVRYSKTTEWPTGSILLIDQVGILAELYTWSDIAFIGGSFKKQVHSVMEALAAGLPVMVGPFHQNNREALFYQKKNFSSGMIVQVVHSSEDLVVLIDRMRKQFDQIPHIKEEIRSEIGKNKNSTQRVLSSLAEQF